MGTEVLEAREKDSNLELPYYASYSKQPTNSRVILPIDHQIQYTANLPWERQQELGLANSEFKITATNKAKPRSIDVDLEEDAGAYATYIPVTYQLPQSDEVIRKHINSQEMNDMSDKLDSVKEDITKSISKLLRNSGSCRLCNIFSTEDSKSSGCNGDHFHDREANYYRPYVSYNPEMDYEARMKRMMRPTTLTRIADSKDDWEMTNPIRTVQNEINKKAAAIHLDSAAIRRKPLEPRFRRALKLPVYDEPDADEDYGIPKLSPLPTYRVTRYPTDHLLTRRRGYKFIS
jgi:hypothetical protein